MTTPHHRLLDSDAASAWLGIELLRADPGHATIRMRLRPEMLNGFAIAHGGMVFAFADTCFALACNHPTVDDGTITVASGVTVDFLRPAQAGDVLVAEGKPRYQGRASGLYDVTVTSDAGTVVAEFRGRCRTIAQAATSR